MVHWLQRVRADDPTPQESFQFSLVHVRALSFVRDHHGGHTLRLDDRQGDRSPRVVSGRPRAAGCASTVPRRGIQGLIYEQEVYQTSSHAPLYFTCCAKKVAAVSASKSHARKPSTSSACCCSTSWRCSSSRSGGSSGLPSLRASEICRGLLLN